MNRLAHTPPPAHARRSLRARLLGAAIRAQVTTGTKAKMAALAVLFMLVPILNWVAPAHPAANGGRSAIELTTAAGPGHRAVAALAANYGQGTTCPYSAMYIVAHQDDTLLFQSPTIQQDISSGWCVRTVFVTAGDDGQGEGYWGQRELGAEASYAQMAGVADDWTASTITANGHPILLETLTDEPTVSIVFMRLPDGGWPNGTGTSMYGFESLMLLWEGSITTITADDDSTSYTQQDLVNTLAALMTSFQPQLIAVQDYVGTFGQGDHPDHYATADFSQLAQEQYTSPHVLLGYEDYGTSSLPQNVFGQALATKQSVFYTYGAYDVNTCDSESTCATTSSYAAWLERQYTVGSETVGVVADAGYTQSVYSGQNTLLDGSLSSDQSGDPLGYTWAQTAGPAVQLTGANTVSPTFVAPAGPTTLTFSLIVKDGSTSSGTAYVTVNVMAGSNPSDTITVANPGTQTSTVGTAITALSPTATDSSTTATISSWSATGLPPGLGINTTTGQVTGTPTAAGTYSVTLTATDSAGFSGSASFTWAVTNAADTNLAPLATATASSQDTATGQTAAKAIDGVISGYPSNTTAEWATMGGGVGSWLELTWPSAVTLDHVVLYNRPNGQDQITSGTLTFANGTGASFGTLPLDTGAPSSPSGLTVSFPAVSTTTLLMTVTGVSATTQNIGLAEIQAWGTGAAGTDTITVANPGTQTSTVGTAITALSPTATDSSTTATISSWSATGLPPGLGINTTTGQVTGTPTAAGTYSVTLTATDSAGFSGSASFTWAVTNAADTNLAPLATATASSQDTATGQTAAKAIDGVISGYPSNTTAEWATMGGGVGSWLELTWPSAVTLDHVVLYNRPNGQDQITSGTLTFANGTGASFGTLPLDTGAPSSPSGLTVSFPAVSTTTLLMTVTGVSATTQNIGLAEIQAWGTGAAGTDTITVANPGTQTSTVGTAITALSPTATDSSTTATISSWSATGLPPGLGINTTTGQVTGTPTAAGTYSVTLTATDSAGFSGSASFTWAVSSGTSGGGISAVGSFANDSGSSTLSVSPKTAGDVLVMAVQAQPATSAQVGGLSGGGVATWSKAIAYPGSAEGSDVELWWGVVSTPGASTVTVTWTGSTPEYRELAAQEFGAGTGAAWSVDKTGGSASTTGTVTFASLTPSSSSGELYFGYGAVSGGASAGPTPGFSYDAPTANANVVAYDGDVTATAGPTAPQSSTGSDSVAVLLAATSGSSGNTVTVTNPGTQTSTVGTAITALTPTATDSSKTATISSWSATGLPAGLAINTTTGQITGTPTTASTGTVTLTATDSAGYKGSASFTWTVNASSGNTVTVTNPGTQTSTVGTAITALTPTATDSSKTATISSWSATGLPAGLAINTTTGQITGTPTTASTGTVTLTATDSAGYKGSASFTWTVNASSANTVTVTNPGTQTSTSGKAVTPLTPTATDSSKTATISSWSATGLPAGLAINTTTGQITGTPTTASTGTVTLTATDSAGYKGSASFTWTVTNTVTVTKPASQNLDGGQGSNPAHPDGHRLVQDGHHQLLVGHGPARRPLHQCHNGHDHGHTHHFREIYRDGQGHRLRRLQRVDELHLDRPSLMWWQGWR